MRIANAAGEVFHGRALLFEFLGRVAAGAQVFHAGLHDRGLVVVNQLQSRIDRLGGRYTYAAPVTICTAEARASFQFA